MEVDSVNFIYDERCGIELLISFDNPRIPKIPFMIEIKEQPDLGNKSTKVIIEIVEYAKISINAVKKILPKWEDLEWEIEEDNSERVDKASFNGTTYKFIDRFMSGGPNERRLSKDSIQTIKRCFWGTIVDQEERLT